jgi:hypothetical protein
MFTSIPEKKLCILSNAIVRLERYGAYRNLKWGGIELLQDVLPYINPFYKEEIGLIDP